MSAPTAIQIISNALWGEPESLVEGIKELKRDPKLLPELCPQLAPLPLIFSGKGASRWHVMQGTSSITAVHVWQTNVSFWNWSWSSSIEWGRGEEPAVTALDKQNVSMDANNPNHSSEKHKVNSSPTLSDFPPPIAGPDPRKGPQERRFSSCEK